MLTTTEHHARTLGEVVGGTRATKVAAFAGLLTLAVGSLGPWVTVLGVNIAGTSGDGKLTLGAAVLAALAVAFGSRRAIALATILTVLAVIAVGYDLAHVEQIANGNPLASTGWGMYAALAGGLFAVFALAGEYIEAR